MFNVKGFDNKTISWWSSERDSIDFDPPYQRKGSLWSKKDKAYLIDSIINDFDIPKIYLADFTYVNTSLNQRGKSYAIIDGKQRLETIFEFFDGKLSLADDFIYHKDQSLKLGGLGYKDLKTNYVKIASKFENYNLSVMSVITDEENMINDMFVRLNRNKPLTGAEVRGAMKGEIPKLIKYLAETNFFRKNISFNTNRKQDHNIAARLLLTEFRGKFVDTKKFHLDQFVDEGTKSETTNFKSAAEDVKKVLILMNKYFQEKDTLLKTSSVILIYYWLFRNFQENSKYIRNFLIDFYSKKTKLNVKEINEFKMLLRNVVDQGTAQNCYRMLSERFVSFMNSKNP